MKNNFLILILCYLLIAIFIMAVIPISKTWALVSVGLIFFSLALQWYWNKTFKQPLTQ